MSNIYVHLSGRLPSDFYFSDRDVVYFSHSVDSNCIHPRAIPLPAMGSDCELPLVQSYHEAFVREARIDPYSLVGGFINDFYSYSVRPAFSIFLAVAALVRENPDSRIFVLSAKANGVALPLLGFMTTESRKGSAHLFGAVISNNMRRMNVFDKVEFVQLPGDLLCLNWLRRVFIKCVAVAFSFNYMLKLAWETVGRKNKSPVNKLLICRNMHQFRFASPLLARMNSVGAIFIPQLAFGSWREFLSLSKGLKERKLCLSFRDLFCIFNDAISLRRDIRRAANSDIPSSTALKLGDLSCTLDLRGLALEVSNFFPFILYRSTLRCYFSNYSPKKVISFEIVGRMAGIEAGVAKEQSVNLVSVQTVLVSARPYPVFPWANTFYVDSCSGERALSDVGYMRSGKVEYAGPAYDVNGDFKYSTEGRLVFFSQPYEFDITLKILYCLIEWGRQNRRMISLKMHPRDEPGKYSKIISDNPDVLCVESDLDVKRILSKASLAVTRTSSVAKEAIATGCPAVLCMWSKFDQGICADYIVPEFFDDYCSFSESDLIRILADPDRILHANRYIYSGFFGEHSHQDLIRELDYVG